MNRRAKKIADELRTQATDPDHHPLIRSLFKTAADLIDELATDLEATHQQGTDHG